MTKVTGELISIDDSAYDGFKGMTIYGNTVQNLWVNPSTTSGGVTATANEDGSVTLSGTAAGTPSIFVISYILKPNTKYVVSTDKIVQSETADLGCFYVEEHSADGLVIPNGITYVGYGSTKEVIFTTDSNLASARFGFFVSSGNSVSGTYRVMLNEGSTAEPWCPPGLNSVDELSIVTAGKNLLKQNSNLIARTVNGIKYTPNGDGSVKVSGTSTGVADFYLIGKAWTVPETNPLSKLQEEMVLSGGVKDCEVILYGVDDDGNHVLIGSTESIAKVIPGDSEGLKLGKWICYLSIAANKTIDAVIYPQLELGSTATDYEPPSITTTTIDLQGNTLKALPDGTRDELHIDGGGNVVLEKRVYRSHVEADGFTAQSKEYSEMSFGTGCDYFDGVGFVKDSQRNDFAPVGNADVQVNRPLAAVYTQNGKTYFRVGDGTVQTSNVAQLESVKSKVGAKGVGVMWKLAEPQTIDLGTIELPKLRKKPLLNNIWAIGTANGTRFSLAPEIDFEYNQWSTYCDGFRTHGKHSYFDMGCCIAARDTGTPEKKSVTATVPYMSGYYDLSKLYGAIAFEARQLMYRFEFVEDSREELQRKKSQFLEWLSQVHDEEIADDDIPGRHFIGSLSEWEFEEGEEGQSGSLEVTFNCQPFLEADEDTTKTCNAGSSTVTVHGQPVNAYAKTSSGTATIRIGGVTQSVGTTEIRLSVQLQPGDNAVTVTGSPVVLRWKELTA